MTKKEEKKRRFEDKIGPIDSVIAVNTTFKGKISGQDSVEIAGNLRGDINCEKLVKIAEGGKIKGTINSAYVIIEGELNGNIESADYVEVRENAHVVGNITAVNIAMSEGCFIQGEIKTPDKDIRPISFVEKRGSEEQQETDTE